MGYYGYTYTCCCEIPSEWWWDWWGGVGWSDSLFGEFEDLTNAAAMRLSSVVGVSNSVANTPPIFSYLGSDGRELTSFTRFETAIHSQEALYFYTLKPIEIGETLGAQARVWLQVFREGGAANDFVEHAGSHELYLGDAKSPDGIVHPHVAFFGERFNQTNFHTHAPPNLTTGIESNGDISSWRSVSSDGIYALTRRAENSSDPHQDPSTTMLVDALYRFSESGVEVVAQGDYRFKETPPGDSFFTHRGYDFPGGSRTSIWKNAAEGAIFTVGNMPYTARRLRYDETYVGYRNVYFADNANANSNNLQGQIFTLCPAGKAVAIVPPKWNVPVGSADWMPTPDPPPVFSDPEAKFYRRRFTESQTHTIQITHGLIEEFVGERWSGTKDRVDAESSHSIEPIKLQNAAQEPATMEPATCLRVPGGSVVFQDTFTQDRVFEEGGGAALATTEDWGDGDVRKKLAASLPSMTALNSAHTASLPSDDANVRVDIQEADANDSEAIVIFRHSRNSITVNSIQAAGDPLNPYESDYLVESSSRQEWLYVHVGSTEVRKEELASQDWFQPRALQTSEGGGNKYTYFESLPDVGRVRLHVCDSSGLLWSLDSENYGEDVPGVPAIKPSLLSSSERFMAVDNFSLPYRSGGGGANALLERGGTEFYPFGGSNVPQKNPEYLGVRFSYFGGTRRMEDLRIVLRRGAQSATLCDGDGGDFLPTNVYFVPEASQPLSAATDDPSRQSWLPAQSLSPLLGEVGEPFTLEVTDLLGGGTLNEAGTFTATLYAHAMWSDWLFSHTLQPGSSKGPLRIPITQNQTFVSPSLVHPPEGDYRALVDLSFIGDMVRRSSAAPGSPEVQNYFPFHLPIG